MRKEGLFAIALATRPVKLTTGESVRMTLALTFNRAGAIANIEASIPPPHQVTAEERAAALLVEAIGAKLRRRPDIGIAELRRRAEAALHLLEQLEDLETERGFEARALFRGEAA